MYIEGGLCPALLILFKMCIFEVIKESDQQVKTVKNDLFWQVVVHLRCANLLNLGQQNGLTWNDMIDRLNVWARHCESYLSKFEFFEQNFDLHLM